MKKLFLVCAFISASWVCGAQAYTENIEARGTDLLGNWSSEVKDFGPVRGYFYAFSDTFESQDNCDEVFKKIHTLISDWNKYPGLSLYSMAYCRSNTKTAQTIFLYAFDLWDVAKAPVLQKFLADHQGVVFENHKLDFSQVISFEAISELTLFKVADKKMVKVYGTKKSLFYNFEDEWYAHNREGVKQIRQPSKEVFLKFVDSEFGTGERSAFESSLPYSNFISFVDTRVVTLKNGKTGYFWVGDGVNKDCGANACYSVSTLLRPFSLAR